MRTEPEHGAQTASTVQIQTQLAFDSDVDPEAFDDEAYRYADEQAADEEAKRNLFAFADRQQHAPVDKTTKPARIRNPLTPQAARLGGAAHDAESLEPDGDEDSWLSESAIGDESSAVHVLDLEDLEPTDSADGQVLPVAVSDSRNEAPTAGDDIDWDKLAADAYEYEEAPTRSELSEIETEGPVSRRDRALQQARELGLRYGWDERGVQLLGEIFETYSWSATKRSLQRELELGCTPDELALAHELRFAWRDSPHFGVNLNGYTHEFLSWPLAFDLVRVFRQLPDVTEIEAFLNAAHDDWRATAHLQRSYPAFRDYVKARASSSWNDALCSPAADIDCGSSVNEFENDTAIEAGWNNQTRRDLEEYGLIRQDDVDRLIARVGSIEWLQDL